jgi:hypothetical protein
LLYEAKRKRAKYQMRLKEIITETVADDHLINRTARLVANDLVRNFERETRNASHAFEQGKDAYGITRLASFDPALETTPGLANTLLYIAEPSFRDSWQAVSYPPGQESSVGVIYLNWQYFEDAMDDPESLRPWLVEKLSHEIRHILDGVKQQGLSRQTAYWKKPKINDEPDTTGSEINAYFTQILHTVEDTIKSNNITDVNRALQIGQEALKDSQLVDAIIGGWDNNNPVLRRLSARMAQFVHSLLDKPQK